MARFKIEIEQNKITKTLTLADKEYTSVMIEDNDGTMVSHCSIQALVEQDYPEVIDDGYIYEALDDIESADEDEVMELLEVISELE